uniref:polo kinase n=1 Tax=Oncorhynchus kisutch TaxID=8019 RepID=A0A8C7KGW5_ONCKI
MDILRSIAHQPTMCEHSVNKPSEIKRKKSEEQIQATQELSRIITDPTKGKCYCRGKVLGKGGFAKCYEFTDLASGKVYAAKIIPHTRVSKPHQREKVCAMDLKLGRLVVFIVMTKVTNPPSPLPVGNFFINESMDLKVGDFGLAAKLEPVENRRRTICGTPNYLSPEVLNKQGHGCESDIWALGCVMYTMLLGRPPFETTNLKETYRCIREARYTLPSSLTTQAKQLISRMLAKSPADRPHLEDILRHDFFTQGFTPDKLSASCCHTAPDLHHTSPAKSFFKKAAAALFGGGKKDKAKYLGTLNRMAKEEEELTRLRNDLRKTSISQPLSRQASENSSKPPVAPTVARPAAYVKEGVNGTNKQQLKDTIRLIVRGTLGSCSSECLEDSTMGSVADTVARVLKGCLEDMPEADDLPKENLGSSFQWVTKWVDYSNKYGFGYQLSDHTVGVLFNNGTHMSLLADKRTVHYYAELGHCSVFSTCEAPEPFIGQVTILKYFAHYMEENLMDGGDLPNVTDPRAPRLYLLQWLKSDRALMMLFNDGTFQVNFYHDHTKILLCRQSDEYLLTYINEERISTNMRLSTLLMAGCSADLCSRMEYALNMLLQRCN